MVSTSPVLTMKKCHERLLLYNEHNNTGLVHENCTHKRRWKSQQLINHLNPLQHEFRHRQLPCRCPFFYNMICYYCLWRQRGKIFLRRYACLKDQSRPIWQLPLWVSPLRRLTMTFKPTRNWLNKKVISVSWRVQSVILRLSYNGHTTNKDWDRTLQRLFFKFQMLLICCVNIRRTASLSRNLWLYQMQWSLTSSNVQWSGKIGILRYLMI